MAICSEVSTPGSPPSMRTAPTGILPGLRWVFNSKTLMEGATVRSSAPQPIDHVQHVKDVGVAIAIGVVVADASFMLGPTWTSLCIDVAIFIHDRH